MGSVPYSYVLRGSSFGYSFIFSFQTFFGPSFSFSMEGSVPTVSISSVWCVFFPIPVDSQDECFFLTSDFQVIRGRCSGVVSSRVVRASPGVSYPVSSGRLPPMGIPILSPRYSLGLRSFSRPLECNSGASPSSSMRRGPTPSTTFLLHLVYGAYSVLRRKTLHCAKSLYFYDRSSISFSLRAPTL